jgi:hypothetical protein
MIALMAGLYPLVSALRADLDQPPADAASEPAVALARAA